MLLSNELLLLLSVPVIYGGLLLWYRLFGKNGLIAYAAAVSILANTEVMILVEAFGIQMTLGNVLFASTFLATDILSEVYGEAEAKKAVHIGIASSVTMIVITQSWLLYSPADGDFAFDSVRTLFSNTPRLLLASFVVFAMVQRLDVALYHAIWRMTEKKSGSKTAYLWLRNNAATMLSQLVNAVLYTLGAFAGIYPLQTLLEIMLSSYLIFIVTSLADTPFLYLARKIVHWGETF